MATKKINNPLDAAICDMIGTFALDQIEKTIKGTFTAKEYQEKLEDTSINVRKLFMRLRAENMI